MIQTTLIGIQIMGILFGLFMLYITFLHQRRKEFTVKESIFWFSAWGGLILIAILPTSLDFFITDIFNLSRRLDFFIILGLIFVIGLMFHMYIIIRTTQNKIEKLVREIAIKEAKDKNRK